LQQHSSADSDHEGKTKGWQKNISKLFETKKINNWNPPYQRPTKKEKMKAFLKKYKFCQQ
jgi:hypothetical protein